MGGTYGMVVDRFGSDLSTVGSDVGGERVRGGVVRLFARCWVLRDWASFCVRRRLAGGAGWGLGFLWAFLLVLLGVG